jgi:amino acid adenylation domain-containing protein/non-ribosomal peptide synthase protein (TIGR01720 family)
MHKNLLIDLDEFKEAEKYWLAKLSGELNEVKLLRDFAETKQYEKGNFKIAVEDSLREKLLKIAKNNRLSLYIIFLTAFKVLISRYTGQEDIVVVSPIYTPSNEKYNKYVALRDFIDVHLTFKEQVINVRETVVEGYKNEHYPFGHLIDLLDIDAGGSLSRIVLLLDTIHKKEFITGNIEELCNDIILSVLERAGRLEIEMSYNSKLFKPESVQNLVNVYLYVLEQVLNNIDINIADIEFMTAAEKEEILSRFSESCRELPGPQTIQELFERQVEKAPDNTAVSSTVDMVNVRLSYGELNRRVNRLAHQLRQKGEKAGSIVGLMVSHPLELVVGIMGILKAGGAYLPLEADYPLNLKAHILEDSNIPVLLTEASLLDDLPQIASQPLVVTLDEMKMAEYPESNPEPLSGSSDPAYVIYTSGTTGKPKGTLVEHKGLVNYSRWRIETYKCTEEDVALQPLSYCFDGFGSNFYTTLFSGGNLYVVPAAKRADPEYIRKAIRANRVSNVSLVPALYRMILEIAEEEELKSMRFVVLAGDISGEYLIRESKKKAPHIQLFNEYGPTEATVAAAGGSRISPSNTSLVGKPIAHTRIYILDGSLEPTPLYVGGELCISGKGLARGYLNNPELTREKFIENPFEGGQRLYRTGDLARWLPGGDLEFLGRIDHQVKIRGFRMELAEIETRLLKHKNIKETAVIVLEEPEDKYLCACCVLEDEEETFNAAELKEFLAGELPDYMIPQHFVRVESIPLTRNGKVDRRALAAPELEADENYAVPTSGLERKLVEIWSEALGVEKEIIGLGSDFFDLGGHSLKAAMITAKIQKELDVDVPLAEIFKKPTIRALASYIEGAAGAGYAAIEPAEEKEYHPLSPAQKRLYVLMQMGKNSTAYNSPQMLKLETGIDAKRFKNTLEKIVQRHESFRTSFEMVEGEAVQRIHPGVEFQIEYYDTGSMSIIEDFTRPFDLEKAPLFRVGLGRIEEKQNILLVDFHHIITDGVSHQLFIKEFMRLYAGEELTPLRLQYKDYSQWRHTNKQKEGVRKKENYWLREFPGEIPLLNLPTDYKRPAFQDFAGNTIVFFLDKETAWALKNFAVRQESTLFMLLLTIFNVLLFKLTGQEDIVLGTPVAGRRHADLENIIGIFVNTLALRNYPSGGKTFTGFWEEVRERVLQAFENQDYPFETLVDKISAKRDASRNPLFDVMFAMQNVEITTDEITEVKVEPYEYDAGISKFDLSFNAAEAGEQLYFAFEYSTQLFKRETIERFIRYFNKVASSILKDPEKKIADMEIISEVERRQVLEEFNGTNRDFPGEEVKTIAGLFAEQVERTPDHVAVVGVELRAESVEQLQMTYGELNKRAGQLAYLLREKGVTHDTIVGIMVRRSIEMMVGILGILKAGGAYLPIDPDYPHERINYMLKDSEAGVLLGEVSELSEVSEGTEVIDLSSLIIESSDAEPAHLTHPTHLCYVIYTSGTTGRPNGVMIEHRNVINYVNAFCDEFDFTAKYTIIQQSSYSFDTFAEEIFPALLRGGKIAIPQKNVIMDIHLLSEFIAGNNVNIISCTPLILNELNKHCPGGSIDTFISGGDVLKREYIDNLLGIGNVYNTYGPTEATICTTYFRCSPEMPANIPIGKPILNYMVYILDKNGRLQPPGVPGELCISGKGIARGYLNRPELTAEKFLSGSKKIYKTGDLVRWLPDGNIEFLGRIDFQVKIRGYRIELGEIERQLLNHEIIKDAVVIAKEDKDGERYLCAFLVSGKDIDPGELREFLSRQLPLFQVPAHIVQMEKIPLTSNGKVDRKLLVAQDIESITDTGDEYDIPLGEVEEKLVEKWQEVLGIQKVRARDNFFEIGGDSIKAIQISARLKEYDLKLEIKDLFLNPTIKDLAPHVKKVGRDTYQGTVTGEIPLTPIQCWFFENNFTGSFHFNHAVMLCKEDGFDKDIIEKVFTKIVEHHDTLRIMFEKKENKIVQRNRGSQDILFHLQVLNMMENSRETIEKEIEKESNRLQRSISLDTGPLIKLGLFKTPGGDHLLIIIHHLVVDGISWRILMEDFTTGCQQALNNEEIKFPYKTDSFKYWASRLVEYSGTGKALRELSYWQNIEEQKIPKLPRDHEIDEENKKQKDVENLYLELPEEDTICLLRDVNRAYNTEINDILLTALAISIKQWANTGKILISLEGHGRENIMEDVDISRTVGWFTSMYPVLFDMTCCRDTDTAACIKSVKETLRKVPNKGVGYGILRYLTPQEKDKTSIFTFQSNPEISFNYLGQFQQDNEAGFAGLSGMKTGEGISPGKEWKYAVDINGMIAGEKLSLTFTYNTCEYDRHTIQRLIDCYGSNLEEIIRHCSRKEESEFTPGDFTKHDMDIEELEDVLEMVDGI